MKKTLPITLFTLLLLYPVTTPANSPFYSPQRTRANAVFFKAMDLKKEKKFAAALQGIKQAILIDPSFGTYYLQAARICLHRLKKYPEAVSFYRRAARLMPDNPWPVTELAHALERVKQYGRAVQEYRRAIAWFKSVHRPPLYRLYTGLGRALRDYLKQPRKALAVYREALTLFPDRVYLLLGSAECRADIRDRAGFLNDCRNAVATAKRYYFRVPYDVDMRIAQILRTRLRAPRETLRHLQAARHRHPQQPYLKIQTAYAFSNLKQYTPAVRWYEAGLNQYRRLKLPHNFWYYIFLSRVLRVNLKQPKPALDWLKRADRMHPGNPHITVRIGHTYGDLKQYRKQIRAYMQYILIEEAAKKKPGMWVYHWIADILRRDLKQPEESIRFLKQSISNHPADPYLHERLGHARGDLKQYRKQVAAYLEYVRLCEKAGIKPSAWRLCNMGDILRRRLKNPEASLRILNRGAGLYPKHTGFSVRIGHAYGALRQYRKQYNAYLRYIRLTEKNGKRPSAWIILSCSNLLRIQMKAPGQALTFLTSMGHHHPQDWQFPLQRGFALEAIERWKDALDAYREASRLRQRKGQVIPGWLRGRIRRAERKIRKG